jgi:phosphoglycerate dehydrogenase-like enzyme
VAGVTKEASKQASLQVTEEMLRVLRGEMPETLVNPEVRTRLGLR